MTQKREYKDSKNETANTTAKLLRRRKERKKNRGNTEVADWESCDSKKLQALIAVVAFHHGTVTFGYTRDGGAFYISYYIDGDSEKIYPRPSEDIDARLDDEIEGWKL